MLKLRNKINILSPIILGIMIIFVIRGQMLELIKLARWN